MLLQVIIGYFLKMVNSSRRNMMNNKMLIKIMIFILFISFAIILLVLYKVVNSEDDNLNIINNYENNYSVSNTNIDNEIVDLDDSEYIFYFEDETGSAKYSEEQLDNFEVELNIPYNILKYILNKKEFYLKIKEYLFLNGLVDATKVEYQSIEENKNNNLVKMLFKLNNPNENNILVVINLNDNSIEIIGK